MPNGNPINDGPYHLVEVGATPEQELAFGLSIAVAYLDKVQSTKTRTDEEFEKVGGRIKLSVNSGSKLITEKGKKRDVAT
jgi:Methylmalonyl-CoA mutase, N-terminal domain/subunit